MSAKSRHQRGRVRQSPAAKAKRRNEQKQRLLAEQLTTSV